MTIRPSLLAAFAGAALLAACGQTAAVVAAPQADSAAAPAVSTRDFIREAAALDAYLLEAAALAAAHAEAPAVKRFAEAAARAHRGLGAELAAQAEGVSETIPDPAIGARLSGDLDALRSARGAAFDTMYVNQQVAAYARAAMLFEAFAAGAPEGPLKAWAADTAPALAAHLAAAQALATPQPAPAAL